MIIRDSMTNFIQIYQYKSKENLNSDKATTQFFTNALLFITLQRMRQTILICTKKVSNKKQI